MKSWPEEFIYTKNAAAPLDLEGVEYTDEIHKALELYEKLSKDDELKKFCAKKFKIKKKVLEDVIELKKRALKRMAPEPEPEIKWDTLIYGGPSSFSVYPPYYATQANTIITSNVGTITGHVI